MDYIEMPILRKIAKSIHTMAW